ncbi:AI-2E family transporter [Moritella viscosa]
MKLILNENSQMRNVGMIAAVIIILGGIKIATPIIIPFLLAVFIAIICNPLVNVITRCRIPRAIAIFIVLIIAIMIGLTITSVIGSSVQQLTSNIGDYQSQIRGHYGELVMFLNKYNIKISSDTLLEYFNPGTAVTMVSSMVSSLSGVMANIFLILLTVVFMLFEGDVLPKKLHLMFKDPDFKLAQLDKFLDSVNKYVAIMLFIMDVDFYLLWGLIAFLLNYVPNIGSLIAAVPAVILTTLQLGLPQAGAVAAGYVMINLIMGNVIEPRFMGKGLGLSTLIVFLSLIFWGWLLGLVGMLLAVPLTMIVKIGLETINEQNWMSILISSDVDVKK